MIIIPAGKILTLTGSELSDGAIYLYSTGRQLEYVGVLSSTPLVFGPYISDLGIEVLMNAGTYSYTINAANKLAAPICLSNSVLNVTSNTTLADIPGYETPVLLAGRYAIEVNNSVNCNSSGGVKFAVKQDSAGLLSQLTLNGTAFDNAGVFQTTYTTSLTDQFAFLNISGIASRAINIFGTVTLTKAGKLKLQFAQAASNATASSVIAGGFMRITQI